MTSIKTLNGSIMIHTGTDRYKFPINHCLLSIVGTEVRVKCIGEPVCTIITYRTREEAEIDYAQIEKLIDDFYRACDTVAGVPGTL
jgi:hypothetical protein